MMLSSEVFLQNDGYIEPKTLNDAFRKLVGNDQQLVLTNNKTPSLWEQRWYNDPGNDTLYYKAGDAVWINTQSIDDVIRARHKDLYAYASSNASLKQKLDRFLADQDDTSYYLALKEFALGKKSAGNMTGIPIFWCGDLSANAQVRVSTIDNNTSTPDDDKCWQSFFYETTDAQVSSQFIDEFHSQLSSQLDEHLVEFHLSGAGITESTISSKFLLKDFSNLSGAQTFNSHMWYDTPHDGFDCVKMFISKRLDDGSTRWFKIWNSGYLEHGGIISSDQPITQVKLNWKYGEDKTAPTYDYPSEGLVQFYGQETTYSIDGITKMIPESYLGNTFRYSVVVTPHCDSPYSNKRFASDVCFLNNDSFSFINNFNCNVFSYKVEGYSLKSKDY